MRAVNIGKFLVCCVSIAILAMLAVPFSVASAQTIDAGPSTTVAVDNSAPALSSLSVNTPSPGTSSTPTVGFTLDESATVTLYSGSGCSTAISSAMYFSTSGAKTMPTNALSESVPTAIYVKAVDSLSNASLCTSIGSYTKDTTAPTGNLPTINAGATTASSITVQWTAAADYNNVTPQANLRYQIQYSTANNTADASQTVGMAWTTNVTQAVVTGLSGSTTYYFWLKVKDSLDNTWVSASPSTVTAMTSSPFPATPTNFTATNGSASIAMSWTAVSGATGYTLSRSTTSGGTYTAIASPASGATSYTDASLTTSGTYYYRIVAINAFGTSLTPASASGLFDNTAPTFAGVSPVVWPTNTFASVGSHQCLVMDNGSVRCWGNDQQGQCGDNRSGNYLTCSQALADTASSGTVVSVVASANNTWGATCGLFSTGGVKCWGSATWGRLGTDTDYNVGAAPGPYTLSIGSAPWIPFGSGRTVKQLAGAPYHICAVLSDDKLRCWGSNRGSAPSTIAQIGQGPTSTTNYAMSAASDINFGAGVTVKQVAAGGGVWYSQYGGENVHTDSGNDITCAILNNNSLKCWSTGGWNDSGALGRGTESITGWNLATATPINLGTGRYPLQVAVGGAHACAILDDQSVKCWGRNNYGQLGQNNTTNIGGTTVNDVANLAPINLGAGRKAKQISIGYSISCALLDDNTVKCWGKNLVSVFNPNIGDGSGTTVAASSPVDLGAGRTAKQISVGMNGVCAVLDDKSIKCWGDISHTLPAGVYAKLPTPAGITLTGNNTTSIGLAATENESSVTYQWTNNSTSVGTVTFASPTSATTTVSATAQGTYSLRLTATNSVGLAGFADYQFTYDTVAPAVPVVSTIGNISGATVYTNTLVPAIVGTSEASAIITVFDGATTLGTTTASTAGAWTFTPSSSLSTGAHTITVKATDAAGNQSSATTAVSLTIDTTAPTIFSVSLTSPSGMGSSKSGVPLDFTVTGSEILNVYSGTPTMGITIGGSARTASYVSGSGTSALVFRYTTVSGDTGIVNTVSPVSGFISDLAGNALTKTFTGAATTRTIDTTAPTVSSVSLTSPSGSGTSGLGAVLEFTVVVSEDVTVTTGTPTLPITIGGSSRNASYVSGSSTARNLVFRYTVVSGDTGTVATVSPVSGTIADAATNALTASFSGASTTRSVDSTLPTVASVNSTTVNGTYKLGDSVSIQVNFSEAVTVTGTPTLALNSGATVNYSSGSGTSSLTFTYTVGSGHSSSDLDYSSTTALTAGTSIVDVGGNSATLTLPAPGATNSLGVNKALVIDGILPTVLSVTSSTADGTYTTGNIVSIQVNFSESVIVTGTPTLALNSGATVNYASGSGTSALTFTYTVASLQSTAELDYSSTSALTAGTSIKDAAGNNATLTLATPGAANSLGVNKVIVIDTTAPTAPVPAVNAAATTGSSLTLTWSAATDNFTSAANLQYQLQYSAANSTADASRSIAMDWTANVTQNLVSISALGMTAGQTYYFWLKVKDEAGSIAYSETTSTVSGATTVVTLAAPTGFTATGGSLLVNLSWGAVSGATGYTLTNSTALNGTYTSVNIAAATCNSPCTTYTFTQTGLTGGTTYYYKLVTNNGGTSSLTPATASAAPIAGLTVPTSLSTAPGSSQVSMTWGGSTGGDISTSLYYQVMRNTTNSDPNASVSGWTIVNGNTTSLWFADTTAVNGTVYYYTVRAVRGVNSAWTTPVYARPGPPDAPVVTASGGAGFISLSWAAPASMGTMTYTVMWSAASAGTYAALSTNQSTTSFVNGSLADNTTRYYKVYATNSIGMSAASNTASATTITIPAAVPSIMANAMTSADDARLFQPGGLAYAAHYAAYVPLSGSGWAGGERSALGDVNGDGYDDWLTGVGPNGGPAMAWWSGSTWQKVASWWGATYNNATSYYGGGLHVASCDTNNDGYADLVRGVGFSGGGWVCTYDGSASGLNLSGTATGGGHSWCFQALEGNTATERRVGCSDVDGDGYGDVLVSMSASASGYQDWLDIWSGKTRARIGQIIHGFPGAWISGGDLDGDGKAEIVVASQGNSVNDSAVKVFRGNGTQWFSYVPYTGFKSSVTVGTVDIDLDGLMDVVTGAGPGGGPAVAYRQTFNGVAGSFYAYAYTPTAYLGGVSVAGGYRSAYTATYLKPNLLSVGGAPNAGSTMYVNTQTPALTGTNVPKSVMKVYTDGALSTSFSTMNVTASSYPSNWSTTLPAMAAGSHSIIARAAFGNIFSLPSTAATVIVDLTAPTAPVILNAQSTFNATYMVTLQTSPSPDAYLKNFSYTLDGTNPTCSTGTLRDASTGYTITIPAATTTLKAVACDLAGNVSPVTSATYTYNGVSPLVPTISPSSSDIKSATVVTISQNATADLNFKEFRYTTDGTAPTCTSGTALTAAPFTVTVSSSVTLKAVTCVFGGNTSPVASAVYTYDAIAPLVPTLSVASRSFNTAFNVTVTQNATTDANFKHFRYMSALGTNPPNPGSCSNGTALGAGGTIAITTDTTSIGVVACDYAGNISARAFAVYTYDAKAPVLRFNSISPLSPSSSLYPSVNLTSTDAGTATLYSNSSCSVAISTATAVTADTAISLGITTALTSNATNVIYAKAVDATGNNSLCTSMTSFVTDVAAPTLTYNSISPASPSAVRNPVVTVTASETGSVTLYNGNTCATAISNATPVVAATSKGIMTYALPGMTSNTIYGKATDSSNNTSACSALLTTYNTSAGNNSAVIASTASTWNGVAVTTCNAAATCSSTYPWTLPNTTVTNATAIVNITINNLGYVKIASNYTGTIQNIIVNSGGTLEIQSSTLVVSGNVTVASGGIITGTGFTSTTYTAGAWSPAVAAGNGQLIFSVAGTLNNAGTIQMNGKGFKGATVASYKGNSNKGVSSLATTDVTGGGGGGGSTSAYGAGASYGTLGTVASATGASAGKLYGASDFWTQLYLGSGGGCGTSVGSGNDGGGAIRIRAASLVNSGTISANGATIVSINKCGGGSGGTIYLAGYPSGGLNFSNSGTISATGGTGGSLNGLGGKGRIRIEPAAILASLGTLDPAPDSAFFGSSAVPTSLTTVNLNDSSSTSATQSTYTVAGITYNIGAIGAAATSEAQFDVDTILSGKTIGTLAFGLNANYTFNGNRSYTTLTTFRSTVVFNGNVTVSNGATFDRSTTTVTGDLTVASGATSLNPTGLAGTLTVSGTMTTAALTVGVATTLNAGALTTNGDLTTTGTSGVITSGNITVNGNMTVAAATSVTAPAFSGTWSGYAWSPSPATATGRMQLTVTGTLNNAGTIQMDGKGFKGATVARYQGDSPGSAGYQSTAANYGGGGGSTSAYGAGGSYGTLGTVASATGASAGQLYGASDFWTQLYLGSGGGCGTSVGSGNDGGGAIKIRAASFTNSGTISANGATIVSINKCGGGSGGTIYLAGYPSGGLNFSNSGTISATGGTGGSLNGLGGKGRIRIEPAAILASLGTLDPAPDSAFFGSSAVPTSLTTVNLNDSTSTSATQSTYTVAGITYNIGAIGPASTGEAQFDVDTILSGKSIGTLAFGLNANYTFNGNRSYTTLTTFRSTTVFNGNVTVSNGATFDRSTTTVNGDMTVASGATSLNPTGLAGTLTVSGTMTTAALTVGVATTLNAGALTTNGNLTTTSGSGVITSGNITVNGNMTVAAATSVTAPAFSGTWSGYAWSPSPATATGRMQLTVTGTLNNAGTIQMDGKGHKGATLASYQGDSYGSVGYQSTAANYGGGGGGTSAYGAGGSYGTLGTVASATGAAGQLYGASDFWTQLYLGSGGGCGTSASSGNDGGGAIKIRAASLVNSGTISAKGMIVTINKCGGGSGGTIYLAGYPSGGLNFSNSGTISATGGTGGSLNGLGGKGRIRIEPAAILASSGTLDPAPDSAFFGSSAVPTSLTTVNLNDSSSTSATQSSYTVAGITYNIGAIGPADTGEAQFDVDTILSGKSIGTLAFGLNAYYKFNGNRSYTTLTTFRSTAVFNGNVTVSNGATFDRSTTTVNGDMTVASGATSLNPSGLAGTLTVSGTMTTAALTVGVATTLNAGALTTNGNLTTTGTSGVITSGNITVNGNMTVAALTSVTAPAFSGTWSGSAWSPRPGVGNGLLQLTVTGILNNAGTIQMDGKGFKGATVAKYKGNSNMGASSLATTDVTGGGGGGGSSASAYGAGGSYGTLGTVVSATGASAGQLYGASDFWTQLYLGSGGGCGTSASSGSDGGGAIKIRAASVTNSGTISAKGMIVTINKCGGGSGGTIMMSAYPTGNITVTNSGTISATGGTGGSLNGLGGSGRFGLQAASTTLAGTVNPPATSVSATSPTIQNVTLTSPKNSGSVIAGVPLTFTVITSERITVTGTPTMPITIGGVAATASYISGSGTQSLLFRYTTVAGRDGVVAYGSPLALNGGTMLSATSVSLALTVMAGSTAVTVDTTAPSAPSVSPGSQAITSATTAYIYQGGSDVDFMDFRYATDLVSTLSCGSVTNLVTISMWQPTYVAIPMATTALRVIACDTNLNASPVALSTYTYFDTTPDVPYISPGTSVIYGETSVYMSQNTWEADFKEFRYALDLVSSLTCTTTASTVSVSGAQYTYVTIPAATTTMRAIVCDAKGQASSIVTATYTLYDYSAPVPGMIKASTNVTGTGFTLNWEAATDTGTAQADLQYKVCSSTDPANVTNLYYCDSSYYTTTVMDYTTNALSANVTGLTNDQVIYYNVIVKDANGNQALFNGKVQQSAPTTKSSMAFNDAVNAVAAGSDGTIYFGGAFTQVGANSGGLVQLSSSNGSLAVANSALTKVSGTIAATAADGSGGYYIGGSFAAVSGITRNNLAHIDKYGNLDLAWNPNANGQVNAIAVVGTNVYVGGAFTKIGVSQSTRNYLAAVATTDGTLQAWDPNANNVVRALDVSGTILYVGGDFTAMNSVNRNYLAAFWTVDGTLDPWNPNANGNVYALDGVGTTIYAGGTFNTIGGVTRNRIAAIATSGDLRLWDANADNYVYAISVSGSTVYAGGAFTTIGGQARNRIAALDATSAVASTWNPNANNTVYALGVSGSVVYAGGDFTTIGVSTRNYMAGIDATTAVANSFHPNVNNRVNAVSIYGSNVWAGGTFTGVNSTARNYLAAISPDGTLSSAWNPNANGIVRAMALSGTTLYIGGEFTTLGGSTARNRLAAISTAGTLQAWNPNANLTVRALLISGSTVYAGGDFTTMGGATTRNRLASMDASTGALGSWNPNASSGVYALALSPDSSTIYVGGMFSSIGGQPRYGLASLDSTGVLGSWAPDTRTGVFVGRVRALATIGNSVYVGGEFTNITANSSLYPVTYMAEIMSDGNMSWYPNLDAPVQTIMIYGRTVFAGGDFTIFNGSPMSRLAAFYASSKNFPTDWASSVVGSVYALASTTSDGYIYPVGSLGTGFKPIYVGLPPVPPSAPTNVAASQTYNSMYMAYDVRLTWTNSTFAAGSIYGYDIAEDAAFTTMVASYSSATSGSTGYTAQQYTNTTKTYYIRAYAYDNNTYEYVYSSAGQVTVTTGAGDTGGSSSSSSSSSSSGGMGYPACDCMLDSMTNPYCDSGTMTSTWQSMSCGGSSSSSSSTTGGSSTGGDSPGTCDGDPMMMMVTTNNCTSGMAMFDMNSPTYCTCY